MADDTESVRVRASGYTIMSKPSHHFYVGAKETGTGIFKFFSVWNYKSPNSKAIIAKSEDPKA